MITYTKYKLTVVQGFTDDISSKLDNELKVQCCSHILDTKANNTYTSSSTHDWYWHKSIMLNISKSLGGDVLLSLEGEEDNGYLWKEFYRNGAFAERL